MTGPGVGRRPDEAGPPGETVQGIQAVARQLGVTMRALRFYEDKGLIEPQRVGATRVYTRRDIARVQLVLRGKRLGFSLREITEFLDLYDADPEHHQQMRQLLASVRERIALLRRQKLAVEQTLEELEAIERDALARLPRAGADGNGAAPAAR